MREKEGTGPKIVSHQTMLRPDVPYRIKVDRELLGELFLDNGLTGQEVKEISVVVKRQPQKLFLGGYELGSKEIVINVSRIFVQYEICLRQALAISRREIPPRRDSFRGLPTTRRLPEYLVHTPPERGFAFANKILFDATERNISQVCLHEAKHAIDMRERTKLAAEYLYLCLSLALPFGGAVASVLRAETLSAMPKEELGTLAVLAGAGICTAMFNFLKRYSPGEFRARKFAQEHLENPKYRRLAQITPR